MEAWTTVLVALIVALSTLGASFIQNWYSKKRFMVELGRAIDVDARKRRWEVRSEPLLKLRSDLAIMASKQAFLLSSIRSILPTGVGKAATIEVLKKSLADISAYLESGNLQQTLFIQYGKELKDKAEEIITDYLRALSIALHYKAIETKELGEVKELEEVTKIIKQNETRIVEVQELINKRLEEL